MRSESPTCPSGEALWEESILLVSADSIEEAQRMAVNLGRNAETTYESASGETIVWKFDCIQSIYAIIVGLDAHGRPSESGTEVFSRYMRASEAFSLLRPIDGRG
jgi:hypothetical protein